MTLESFEEITNKSSGRRYGDPFCDHHRSAVHGPASPTTGAFWGDYRTGDTSNGYVGIGNADRIQKAVNKAVKWDLDLDWIGEEVEVLYQDNNLRGQTAGSLDQ